MQVFNNIKLGNCLSGVISAFLLLETLSCSNDLEMDNRPASDATCLAFSVVLDDDTRSTYAGCNNETEQSFGNGMLSVSVSPMKFSEKNYIDTNAVQTRGMQISDKTELHTSGVYAYHTTNNWATSFLYFDNQKIDYSTVNGTASYSPLKYWPETANSKLNFYGYSPYIASTNTVGTNGLMLTLGSKPVITYTAPVSVANQPDFMIAVPQLNKTAPATNTPIPQIFRHALVSVGFEVYGNGQKIYDVSLNGIKNKGNIDISTIGASSNISWNLDAAIDKSFAAGIKFDAGQSYYTTNSTTSDLMKTDGYLMMLPQTLGADAKLMLTIDYGDGHGIKNVPIDLVQTGLPTEWVAGTRYVYKINVNDKHGVWFRINSTLDNAWVLWDESTTLPSTAAKTFDLKTDAGYTVSTAQMSAAKTYLMKGANNSVDVDMSRAEYVNNSLEASLFSGNAKIKTFALPKNVEEIGDSTFYNCAYLTAVTSTKVISKVGKASFMKAVRLLSIPDMSDITEIPDQCFADCNKLGPTFPYTSNVTTIGYQAFIRCYALTEIASSTSLTTITGKENFMRCEGLLTFPQFPNVKVYPEYCFALCKSLTNVVVPEGADTLKSYSLSSFTGMESIDLPTTLRYMEVTSVGNCPKVSKIISRSVTAPTFVINSGGYSPFQQGNGTMAGQDISGPKYIYIPAGSTGYKEVTDNWYKEMIGQHGWTYSEGLP